MRIAIDAMGGDRAPRVIVDGAIKAIKEYDYEVILVGREDRIKSELSRHSHFDRNKLSIKHAEEVIEMHDPAALSIRKKKASSINIAIKLLKTKEADAFVSAGNTGAVVCAATLFLGLLPGIQRPGIALALPTFAEDSLLIDVGANIDCKPEHILQYAVMGTMFYEYILGRKNPSVGLLNIGEEEGKGTDFAKEAYRLLDNSHVNFIGNIEGRDIYKGKCNIIVCDGFVGNIALKVSESLAETVGRLLKRELSKSIMRKIGALLCRPALISLKKKMDHTERGGAWLLGVDGPVVISHGSSNTIAVKNAIRVAGECVQNNVIQHIVESVGRLKDAEKI